MASNLIPAPRMLAQQVVIALLTAVAVAWIIGHVPPIKAFLKREES